MRADRFGFDVASDLAANSGTADDVMVAPKASLIYALERLDRALFERRQGLPQQRRARHDDHHRPVDGDPAETVDPLVASHQLEVGFRSFVERRVNVSVALWWLELDSELLFIGDAGNTEASRPSRRYGIEVPLYYRPNDVLTLDVELALTQSQVRANSIRRATRSRARSIAWSRRASRYDNPSGLYGSVRLRYFGPRPLIEDGSVESDSSTIVNAALGFRRERLDVRLDLLNAFDSDDHDITYFYASRLPGEADEGVEDLHFHPLEPRMLRAYLNWRF